jgi:hypothetical protein
MLYLSTDCREVFSSSSASLGNTCQGYIAPGLLGEIGSLYVLECRRPDWGLLP